MSLYLPCFFFFFLKQKTAYVLRISDGSSDVCSSDLERLLPRGGLRDDEVIDIDAELLGIDRIEGMLGIHESRGAALLLSFSHRVQCERRLARAFRPVDLDDAAARETADPQGDIEPKRAGRQCPDLDRTAAAQTHGRRLPEGSADPRPRRIEGFLLVHIFGIPVGYDRSEEHT